MSTTPLASSSLQAELAEAKKFISMATQSGVKQLLSEYVMNIESALQELKNGDNEHVEKESQQQQQQQQQLMPKQVSITSYSWDENDTEVKLYLKLPSNHTNPFTEKIMFNIRTDANEKLLRIDFMLLSSSSSTSFLPEMHTFIAQPLKHELETVSGNYLLEKDAGNTNNNENDDDSSSSAFVTPNNSSFVYPGESKTPSGGLLRYCRLKVKKNGDVVVGIQKVMPGPWADLIDKDDFNKPLAFGNTGGKSRSDPNVQQSASLVSLMQQLYKDGDDEMKKTIATAWEESRKMPPPSE